MTAEHRQSPIDAVYTLGHGKRPPEELVEAD